MKLKLRIYTHLCSTKTFEVNGIRAHSADFGEQHDTNPADAEPYGCFNMQFFPKIHTNEILQKYSINIDEYNTICEELKEELSFGKCRRCV